MVYYLEVDPTHLAIYVKDIPMWRRPRGRVDGSGSELLGWKNGLSDDMLRGTLDDYIIG